MRCRDQWRAGGSILSLYGLYAQVYYHGDGEDVAAAASQGTRPRHVADEAGQDAAKDASNVVKCGQVRRLFVAQIQGCL